MAKLQAGARSKVCGKTRKQAFASLCFYQVIMFSILRILQEPLFSWPLRQPFLKHQLLTAILPACSTLYRPDNVRCEEDGVGITY